jgi:hypothetical protein
MLIRDGEVFSQLAPLLMSDREIPGLSLLMIALPKLP